MAFISLKWFAGMVPRRGRQHLDAPHATEAENCNLYSGELRPLKKPALVHKFCAPTDECWRQPLPDDPSNPPEPPPEPPQCVPVVPADIGFDACKIYECDAFHDAIIGSGPEGYWPGNRDSDLALYPSGTGIFDYSGNANTLIWRSPATDLLTATTNLEAGYSGCGSNLLTNMRNFTQTGLLVDNYGDTINGFAAGNDWTWMAHIAIDVTGHVGGSVLMTVNHRNISDSGFLSWFEARRELNGNIRIDFQGNGRVLSQHEIDLNTLAPNYRTQIVMVTAEADAGITTLKAYVDFVEIDSWTAAITYLDGRSPAALECYELMSQRGAMWEYQTLWTKALSPAEIQTLSEAFSQNFTGYVDPNPNCSDSNLLPGPIQGGTVIQIQVDVNADATPPIQYQWYKNNIAMPGEVGPVLSYTLQVEDSYASFTVLVQNPCGQKLSNAITVGEVTDQPLCKVYECDALTTMIQTKNPQSLYDLTQGWAAISTPGSGTGSVTPTSGDLVYDIVGGFDTKMIVGGGNVITPEAAGIFDSCGNTSINSNSLTSRAYPADGLPPWEDGGTLVFVEKDNSGSTGGALGPVYETFTGANPYSSRAIFNGGISEVIVDTAQAGAPGATVNYATTPGARFAAFTWEHSGNSTTVKVYEETGKVYEETVVGTVGGSRDLSYMVLNWYLCSNAVAATWATPLSESDMADIVDSWNQNKPAYVDPNPNCRPPE